MTHTTWMRIGAIAGMMVLLGGGCRTDAPVSTPPQETGPKIISVENMTPEQLTEKLVLVPGSSFEMKQAVYRTTNGVLQGTVDGKRLVVIESFAPQNLADVSWKLITKVPAQPSKKALEKMRATSTTEMVEHTDNGSLKGVNLKNSHMLYLPSYWPMMDDQSALSRSALWLSSDVYEDLAKTRVSTLDFGLTDSEISRRVRQIGAIDASLTRLESAASRMQRVDVFKLDGEKDLVDWPVIVNGKQVRVKVIKARTWFGDIVVLNNKQNPLVLKVSLSTDAVNAARGTSGDLVSSLAGYEVTSFAGIQE